MFLYDVSHALSLSDERIIREPVDHRKNHLLPGLLNVCLDLPVGGLDPLVGGLNQFGILTKLKDDEEYSKSYSDGAYRVEILDYGREIYCQIEILN